MINRVKTQLSNPDTFKESLDAHCSGKWFVGIALLLGVGTGGVGLVVIGVGAVAGGFVGGLLGSMSGEALSDIINENT